MGKKGKAPVGANLTASQKAELKSAILSEYPRLAKFSEEIEMMVEGYSKDKHYLDKLMESINKGEEDEPQAPAGTMKNLGPDDPEYHETMKRMDDARDEFMEKQRKAIEEEEQKQKEKEEEGKVKNVTIISA